MPAVRRLPLVPPLDISASLDPYRRWGDDLLDRWDGRRLLRALPLADGRWVAIRAEPGGGTVDQPALAVVVDPPALAIPALDALGATFVPASPAFDLLRARDPVIAGLEARHRGLRPVLQPDLFTALVRSISAQQVNLTWAAETRRRLARAFGSDLEVAGEEVFRLDPARIAAAPPAAIRALQFTTRKAEAIVEVARAFVDGRIDPVALARLDDGAVIERLTALRGIGPWSAEWILARTFGRPRVVAGDLGVRKAVGRAYLGQPIVSEEAVRAATAHWGAGATVAQALLLRSLLDEERDAPAGGGTGRRGGGTSHFGQRRQVRSSSALGDEIRRR